MNTETVMELADSGWVELGGDNVFPTWCRFQIVSAGCCSNQIQKPTDSSSRVTLKAHARDSEFPKGEHSTVQSVPSSELQRTSLKPLWRFLSHNVFLLCIIVPLQGWKSLKVKSFVSFIFEFPMLLNIIGSHQYDRTKVATVGKSNMLVNFRQRKHFV
jgi:hypothetical protein